MHSKLTVSQVLWCWLHSLLAPQWCWCVKLCVLVSPLASVSPQPPSILSSRHRITSMMLPITLSLSSPFKPTACFSISICARCNRVRYHPLPTGRLRLPTNLLGRVFSYCPCEESRVNGGAERVAAARRAWAGPCRGAGAPQSQQPLHAPCRGERLGASWLRCARRCSPPRGNVLWWSRCAVNTAPLHHSGMCGLWEQLCSNTGLWIFQHLSSLSIR